VPRSARPPTDLGIHDPPPDPPRPGPKCRSRSGTFRSRVVAWPVLVAACAVATTSWAPPAGALRPTRTAEVGGCAGARLGAGVRSSAGCASAATGRAPGRAGRAPRDRSPGIRATRRTRRGFRRTITRWRGPPQRDPLWTDLGGARLTHRWGLGLSRAAGSGGRGSRRAPARRRPQRCPREHTVRK
jgi:hypothetical protein